MSLEDKWFKTLEEKAGDPIELSRMAWEQADYRYCGEDGLFSIKKLNDQIALVPQIAGDLPALAEKIRAGCRKLGCTEMRGASYRPGIERLYARYGMKKLGVIMGGPV